MNTKARDYMGLRIVGLSPDCSAMGASIALSGRTRRRCLRRALIRHASPEVDARRVDLLRRWNS